METWITPKTNWNSSDSISFSDYNRIKNNMNCLYGIAKTMYPYVDIVDMGEDATRKDVCSAKQFNDIEENLEKINKSSLNLKIGNKQKFYSNGVFISYQELNRIESAQQLLKEKLEKVKKRRIPFRFGNFRNAI